MHINRGYARCDDMFNAAARASALVGWAGGEGAGLLSEYMTK